MKLITTGPKTIKGLTKFLFTHKVTIKTPKGKRKKLVEIPVEALNQKVGETKARKVLSELYK